CVPPEMGSKSAEGPRPEVVLAALDARAAKCNGSPSPLACLEQSPPVKSEPDVCAEYQEEGTSRIDREGKELVTSRGTWREMGRWELITEALLNELPTVGSGTGHGVPLAKM